MPHDEAVLSSIVLYPGTAGSRMIDLSSVAGKSDTVYVNYNSIVIVYDYASNSTLTVTLLKGARLLQTSVVPAPVVVLPVLYLHNLLLSCCSSLLYLM